ncbi:MAG TPA: nuclear transport factor 2 family protein [Kofleriaceae bacterium]
MPTSERLAAFISMVENKQFVEALLEFYAEDMTAQENTEPPRIGRAATIANEQRALAVMQFETNRVASYVHDQDRVALHYSVDIVTLGGTRVHVEEVAYQTWEGDHIVHERYFYDPAQMAALRPKS